MDCGQCGTGNRDGARFCRACGAALARRCGSCSAELAADARFCDQCGTPVEATATASPTPTSTTQATSPRAGPSGAVRKTVTVLFADLGGSTGFGERTDPEVSRQVLARYHALLQDAIDDHGGTVAKFMGDGMMATFGIPEIAEDDAHRAVRAGIDIQRRFEAFAVEVMKRHDEALTLRVGVNTGEVVIAAGDADLVGDALNVAARLEKACRPGHVLVGDETWRITRGELAYEPLGEVTVAGRAGSVGTYEVVESEAATTEPVAPFVGRVGETARLLAAFDQARSETTAVLVTVLGSPGMGKTRLSRELASTLGSDERATTFEIRCDRSGGATFAPFADLVRAAAGISEVEDDDETRERIAALVTDDADRARVVDVLAGVLGAAPARSVEETFWALRRIVESLASAHPMVVVIDDIQWAEPKLLDLLEHLAEWVQAAAVLLVCLARPELRDLRPSLTEPGRRVADVVALDGLDAAATADLASGLLGSRLPSELVDRLPSSTDGNPLFVRELVRMLVDDAVIRRRGDGTWELAIDAEAIEVPPTIQSLLATRVERLPPEELRVLELASVVGAEFSVGALRELSGAEIAIPPVLERLRRKELVEPTGSYWGDDPLHRFHHVLIRDAAYRRLLKTTRADLHRRVGAWTDAIAGDLVGEQETAIAFHYEQAHRYRTELGTTDEETDQLGRRAAELLSIASRRALDREDLTAAGALARRALAALPEADVDDRAELLLIACECFLSSGDVAAGAPLVDALGALAEGNEQLAAWAACYRAQFVGLTDPEGVMGAEGVATAAAATLERLGDGAGEAKAHQVRAGLLARLGRVGEAEVVLDLALGAARASDDRRRVTAVLGAAPQAALFGPSPVARAGGRCLDVVRLLRITTASPSVEATSMRCQAVLEALRGRFDVSRSMLASARASLEELGLRHGLLETDLFTGMVELIAGDPAAAIDPLRSAYEGLGTLGVGADAGQAAALLATALLACGETDEAELMAGESEALAGQNLKTAIAWRIARAEVLAAHGDLAAATTMAEAAVEIAAATDLVLDHADACVVLAELHERTGETARAARARGEAVRLYDAKGATVPAQRLARPATAGAPVAAPDTTAAAPRPAERRTPECENRATEVVARLATFLGSDQVPPADLISETLDLQDRRSLVALPSAGGNAIAENFSIMREQGYEIAPLVAIAVRGERLALHRTRARTPAGDETGLLSVDELDAEGRMCRLVWFDEADLAAALAELDARYLLGEGAPFQRVLSAVGRCSAGYESNDLDGVRDQLAPDLVVVDHGKLGWGTGDREFFLQMSRADHADGRGVSSVLHLNEHALLSVNSQILISGSGSRYERSGCVVMGVDATDRINRVDIYADHDFAAALARLDELGTAASTDTRVPIAENIASRFMDRLRLAFNGKDRVALGQLIAPGYVHEDRRSIVASVGLDPRGRLDDLDATIDQGFNFAEPVIIAVRGERLALSRMVTRTAAGDESARLSVNELDAGGRMVRSVLFDEEDLAAAQAELDDWYLAGEGADHASVVRVCIAYRDAHGRRDSDAMRELLAPDFVLDDRTRLGWGEGDRDYFDAINRSRDQVTSDGVVVGRLLHIEGDALLTLAEGHNTTPEGNDYSWAAVLVFQVGDGDRIRRLELFDEDDFATALARLDELGAEGPADPRTARVENAATRADARAAALIAQGHAEALAELPLTDDFVLEDRRTVVALPDLDARGLAENFAAMRAQGYTIQAPQPLAVRGDRLCLSRRVATTTAGDESPLLALTELDEQGRYRRIVFFDADDLGAALAELEAAYFVGEGAPYRRVLLACGRYATASADEDFERMRDHLAPDFVVVDRQPLGFGEGDREYFIDMSRTRTAESEGINRVLHVNERALLAVYSSKPISDEGSLYLRSGCLVMGVDAFDRVDRVEMFADDDFEIALARLDEIGATSPADPLSPEPRNLATQVHARALAAINAGDSRAQRRLTARNFTQDDRRAVVAVPNQDARGIARYHDIMLEQGYEILPPEPLAVRGDRLSLARVTHRTAAGDESILLAIIELDADGLVARATALDEGDLATALAELDERYLLNEGAEHGRVVRICRAFGDANERRDFDAMREMLSTDFVMSDRTRLGYGEGDREYFDVASRSRAEVSPADGVAINRIVLVEGDALLTVAEGHHITAEGSDYSWVSCIVFQVDAEDRIRRAEYFDEDDFATALDRLHELGAADPRSPKAENTTTRMMAKSVEVATAHRFDLLRELLADDFVRADHRSGVSAPVANGPDEFVTAYAAWFEVGFDRLVITPMAVRGEHFALARMEWSSADGRTVGFLGLYETNVDGRFVRGAHFDEDDLVTAVAELDATFWGVDASMLQHLNAHDWDAVRADFHPDAVVVDRRELMWPELDRDGFIEMIQGYLELVPDMLFCCRTVHGRGAAVLTVLDNSGTSVEGAPVEWSFLVVSAFDRDARIVRMEIFDEADFAAALARLDELGVPAPADTPAGALRNTATRLQEQLRVAVNAGDDDTIGRLVSRDYAQEDRRTIVAVAGLGTSELSREMKEATEQGFVIQKSDVLAIRGERLCLGRMLHRTAAGDETARLSIMEFDDHDRLGRAVIFDEDDLGAALAELDERFLAGEGADHLAVLAAGLAWIEASRDQDVEALRAITAPDLVCVDNSPIGFGTLDREGLLAATQLRFELSADDVVIVRSVQVDGSAMLGVHYAETTTDDGRRYEREACYLLAVDAAGLIDRWEVFGEGDYARALARLHELGTGPNEAEPVNAVTRLIGRLLDLMNRGEYEAASAMDAVAADVVRFDRRHTVSAPTVVDGGGFLENAGAIYEVFDVVHPEPVAVRGERFALIRLHCGEPPNFEMQLLCIYEVNGAGQIVWEADYDDDDLDGALTELDERYAAGEGTEHDLLIQRLGDLRWCSVARNDDAYRALFTDDCAVANHRRMSRPMASIDDVLASSRAGFDVAERRLVFRAVECRGDVAMIRHDDVPVTPEGSEYAVTSRLILRFRAGRFDVLELFDADDSAARARFAALAAESVLTPHVDNRAVRMSERAQWVGRFTDARPPFYRGDCVLDDRRPGVNAGLVSGAHAVDASIQSGVDVFGVLDIHSLAVRGERLALVRWAFVADGGFEAPGISVNEFDEDDLVCRVTSFEEGDLASALEFLDARDRDVRRSLSAVERRVGEAVAALNRRDWTTFTDCYSPDLVSIDRTPIGFPPTDRDGFVTGQMQGVIGIAPDLVMMLVKAEVLERTALLVTRARGTSVDGVAAEWVQFIVVHTDREGRADRQEFFAEDDWTGATALFDEWTAADPTATASSAPSVTNAAVRTLVRGGELVMTDIEAALDLFADDAASESHQSGPMRGASAFGRDGWRNALTSWANTYDALRFEPVAVRGERSALLRYEFEADGFVSPALVVVELDADGRIQMLHGFDESDPDSAFLELSDRYVAGEGAEHEFLIRRLEDLEVARRDEDWAAYGDLFHPDFAGSDLRSLGLPVIDRQTLVAAQEAMAALTPSARFAHAWQRISGDVLLALVGVAAESQEGSRYAWSHYAVWRMVEGLWILAELYPMGDFDGASARFEELARVAGTPIDNAAVRAMVRLEWLLRHGSAGAAHAMLADALVVAADVFAGKSYEAIEVRGDRLCLIGWSRQVESAVETSGFDVVEVDEHGRLVRVTTFGESDRAAAVAALEHRHAELLGSASTPNERTTAAGTAASAQPLSAAFAARDWDWIRARVASDVVLEDRRSSVSSHPAVGADAVVDLFQGFADVGFEALDTIHVASRGDRFVLLRRVYRTADGFELEMLAIVETDADGLAASLVLFDADALVAALDELEIRFARSGALTLGARQLLLGFAGLNHRAWTELDAVLAPDLAVADHRLLGFPAADGKEHLVGALQALVAQVPDVVAIVESIETSGPAALAWTRQVGTSTDGATADWTWHFVVAIRPDGRITNMEYFDAHDESRARARFDELAHSDVVEHLVRTFARVYNTRDWEGLRAAYPDLVMVDHRPASFGEMVGAEALVEYLGGLLDLVPDLHVEVPEIVAVAEHGVVFRMVGSGHTTDGGDVEIDILLCSTVVDGRVRAETFPDDAMDAALACWRAARG